MLYLRQLGDAFRHPFGTALCDRALALEVMVFASTAEAIILRDQSNAPLEASPDAVEGRCSTRYSCTENVLGLWQTQNVLAS
jgi:hypothetical protein